MDCLVNLFEKDIHMLCPRLPVLLPSPFKLAQVMGVAQGMRLTIVKVGLPVIMTEDTLVVW